MLINHPAKRAPASATRCRVLLALAVIVPLASFVLAVAVLTWVTPASPLSVISVLLVTAGIFTGNGLAKRASAQRSLAQFSARLHEHIDHHQNGDQR